MDFEKAEQIVMDLPVTICIKPDGRILVCNDDGEAMESFYNSDEAIAFFLANLTKEQKAAWLLIADCEADAFEERMYPAA